MIDKWQEKLQANSEAHERWMRRLLRAAGALTRLREERKRLLAQGKGKKLKVARPDISEIPRMAAGGSDFNDEIPI